MAFVALLWLFNLHLNAQIDASFLSRDYEFAPSPAPTVWGFMRYGNHSADLYTGRVPVSIPIYTYQDNDFTLPISVDYASNGYRPNVQIGILGLGWTLNAGGCITREIRGIPDEAQNLAIKTYTINANGLLEDTPFFYDGYFSYHNMGIMLDLDSIIAKNYAIHHVTKMFPIMDDNNTEAEPDIFHFNFAGYSGCFKMGPQGTIYVYDTAQPHGESKINLDDFPETIKITTGDGYVYTFGGADQNKLDTYSEFEELRLGVPNRPIRTVRTDSTSNDYAFNYRMTWMLTMIEAPNSRIIEFEYSPATQTNSKKYDSYRPSALWQVFNSRLPLTSPAFSPDTSTVFARQRGTTLNRIVVDDALTIDFTYKSKEKKEIAWVISKFDHKGGLYKIGDIVKIDMLNQLGIVDSIIIKNASVNTPLNIYTFDYYTNPGDSPNSGIIGNPITFLSQINLPEGSSYRFDYYDKDLSFPYHGTAAIDHWGYYNRMGDGTSRVGPSYLLPPTGTRSALGDYIYREAPGPGGVISDIPWSIYSYMEHITSLFPNREPNFATARMGMLKRITYPTGGATHFDYEQNSYWRKLYRDSFNGCNPVLGFADYGGYTYPDVFNYPAGGVRIKRLVDYSLNDSTYREFIYQNDIGASSGLLLHYPRYIGEMGMIVQTGEEGYFESLKLSSSNTQPYPEDKSHISYPFVKEVFSDGSYIEHRYNSYQNVPDESSHYGYAIRWGINGNGEIAYAPSPILMPPSPYNLYRKPTSLHYMRGKPLSKKYYNSDGTLLSSTSYSYNNDYQYTVHPEFVSSTLFAYPYIDIHQTIVSPYYLVSEQTTDYRGENPVVQIKEYKYNSVGRLSEVLTLNSQSDSLKTVFRYISDQHTTTAQNKLYQENRLSLPVYQDDYVEDANGNLALNNSIYNIYNYPNSYLTSKATQSKSRNGTYITEYTYDYDAQGRVISITDKAGIKTAYLWGYNGLYPIAEIKNIGTATPSQSYIEETDFQNIQELHSTLCTTYPQAQVTVYTYKPFVGKTTETAPDGTIIYYEYDDSGRLKWTYIIVDGEPQYLEGNKYQYQNP